MLRFASRWDRFAFDRILPMGDLAARENGAFESDGRFIAGFTSGRLVMATTAIRHVRHLPSKPAEKQEIAPPSLIKWDCKTK